nr:hypothetical protein HK105_007972 [Polyrhizophydium stewartii]
MINSGRSSAGGDVGALSDDQKQPRQPTLARKRSAPLLRTPSSHELEQYKPLFPPLGLVEDTLIPHALRICISDSVEPELLWHLLDSLAVVWKRLSVLIARNKAYDPNELTRMTRSLIKCFHLLIRVLPVDAKIEFFCNRLCGNLEQGGDASAFAVVWIPRLIELAIPFLRDDNREVRRHVSAAVMRMLTIMSTALDRTPTIARKREQTSLVTKLQRAYGANRRVQHLFPKSGPRRSRAPSHGVSPAFESGVNFAAAQASSAPGLSMSPDSVPGANANSWPRQMRERLDSFSGVEVSVPESSLPRSSDAAAQTLSASHKARLQYSVPRSESGDSYTAAHFGAADMSTDSATADVAGIGRDSVVHVHEHETWETSWDDFGDEDHVDEGGAAAVHAPLPSANNGDSLTSSSATSAPVTSLSRDNARKAGAAADVNGDPKQDCATPEAGSAADLSLQRTEPPAAMAQRPPLANGSAHPSRLSAHGVPLSASASAPASLPAPPASLTGETGAYANRSSAVPPTPSAAARSPTRLVVRSASSASAHDGASTTDSPTRSVFSDSTSGHDAQALGPSGTSSSFGPTGKYVKRDVLKQKREAKHAETLRRKTSSSSFKVGVVASPNLADSRVMSPTTATAGGPALLPSAATVTAAAAPTARAEKVAVALVQEPAPASAEIDYFKDMVPAQVRKTGILAAATAATVAMTGSIQRTSETLLSDLGELSGIRAAKPPTAGRVAFQGSSTDLADMALGWGEDLDEDISLDNVRLE